MALRASWVVLDIDGEMAQDLIKERAYDAARRLGKPIPDENLVIYSAVDGEAFAAEFPGIGINPPLNTVAGHEWLKKFLGALGHIDLIVFDNVMSLLDGVQKEEESWTGALPLVHWLTAQRIGQVWLDHTGHHGDHQYGTSTKAWRFDTVGILTSASGKDDPEGDLAILAEFRPARKGEAPQAFQLARLSDCQNQVIRGPLVL